MLIERFTNITEFHCCKDISGKQEHVLTSLLLAYYEYIIDGP